MKSSNPAGALPARIRVRSWFGRLLCRFNRHSDGMGQHFDLILATRKRYQMACLPDGMVVGDRIEWTCARCGSSHAYDVFRTVESRRAWELAPSQRMVLPKVWAQVPPNA
jgi:hypothetical protein